MQFISLVIPIISSYILVHTNPIYNNTRNKSSFNSTPLSSSIVKLTTTSYNTANYKKNDKFHVISPTTSTQKIAPTSFINQHPNIANSNTIHCNTNSTNTSICKTKEIPKKYSYYSYYLFLIGGISTAAFPINFLVIIHLCCKKKFRVTELFGVNLAAFNLLLAAFGIAMATYLSQEYQAWTQKFCQGFTSLKLFAIGVNVWTLILLSYYYTVTGAGPNVERDALFKGIVYILEGLMLSGVFAIMAWIKLDEWKFLCSIIEPKTTVDWLLTGIECSYYVILLLLILRYPYHLYKRFKNPKDYPDVRDAPIFIIVFVSCVTWSCGLLLTSTNLKVYSSFSTAAVARMCILLLPTLFQPFLFTLRNTWICRGRSPFAESRKKRSRDKEAQHVCECTGRETCSDCDPEYEPEVTYDEKTLLNKDFENDNIEKTKKTLKKNKKRKARFRFPRAICRSPKVKDKRDKDENMEMKVAEESDKEDGTTENTQLLKDSLHLNLEKKAPMADYEDSPCVFTGSKISEFSLMDKPNKNKETSATRNETLNTQLTEEEGRISRGPTFYPFVENKVKKRKKSSDSKRTPSKENNEKNLQPITNTKQNNTDTNKESKKINLNESKNKKDKKKKRKSKKERNEKHDLEKHESVASLEWDHYSDSSNSSISDKRIDEIAKVKNNKIDNEEIELNKLTNVDLTSNSDNANSDNNSIKNDRKIHLRDLKSAQSCDWEPYSVDESCSSRTSSANKSPEYSPPHSIDNESRPTNGNSSSNNTTTNNNKKQSRNIQDDFILEEEG